MKPPQSPIGADVAKINVKTSPIISIGHDHIRFAVPVQVCNDHRAGPLPAVSSSVRSGRLNPACRRLGKWQEWTVGIGVQAG